MHVQGIVAKPLVETLRLKKNRERNPKIRETQRFQEFENAVKVEIQLFVANLWINNFRQSLFPATSRLSLSPPPGWCPSNPQNDHQMLVGRMEEQGEEDEGCCRSCWRSFEHRVIAPVFTR